MKVKPVPTSPASKREIEKLYKKSDLKTIEKPPAKVKNNRFLTIILAILFGFLAGVLGEIIINSYLYYSPINIPLLDKLNLFSGQLSPRVVTQTQEKKSPDIKIATARQKIEPSLVSIFLKKPQSNNVLDQLYLPTDLKGGGIILTSDGWIITSNQVVDDLTEEYVVVVPNNQILEVIDFLEDPVSGVVFLKVETENLIAAEFIEFEDIYLGQEVLAIQSQSNSENNITLTQIENLEYRPVDQAKDLIQSSEYFSHKILIRDPLNSFYDGYPLIDYNGKIIGINVSSQLEESKITLVIPIEFIKSKLNNVLKEKKIKRNYLGIYYLDLSQTLNISEEVSQGLSKGALIFQDENSNLSAVIKGSPADKAGLKEGDIILKISEQEIDSKNNLTDIIQNNYQVGDSVELKILRDDVEKTIQVKLEELIFS